jgi:transmembrane sensor
MTIHHSEDIDRLLVKILLGEANAREHEEIRVWLALSPDNEAYFSQFKSIWQRSKELEVTQNTDVSLAWERFKKRALADDPTPDRQENVQLPSNETTSPPLRQHPSVASYFLKFAAIICIFVGAASIWYLTNQPANEGAMILVSEAKALHEKLSDGSEVHLNKNSKVSYSATLNSDPVRKLTLEGEAFFNVSKDEKRPFIIETKDLTVKVLGTSFNVKSREERTEITVATGKVAVSRSGKEVILTPGHTLTFTKKSGTWTRSSQHDELYDYYVNNQLTATRQPLLKVINILSEFYETPITVDSGRSGERITTVLNLNKSLDENLNYINSTMGTRHEFINGTYIIR